MSTDYYDIEVRSNDWVFILTKMLRKYTMEGRGVEIVIEPDGSAALFQIPKVLVPAAAIAACIGATEEAVAAAKIINLIPFKRMKDWQQPTVSYYGEA